MPRGLTLVTGPVAEPVSLADLKAHVRQDLTVDDAVITAYGYAARRYIEQTYNRQIASAVWRSSHDRFPRYSSSAVWQYNSDAIWQQRLPVTQLSGQWYPDRASIRVTRPPLQQLLAITYTDGLGLVQSLVNNIPTGVSGTGSQTVTPWTMTGIIVGNQYVVDTGSAQETITVTAVTATTFAALFASTHAANVPFYLNPALSVSGSPLAGGPLVSVDPSTEPGRIAPAYGQIWPIVRQQLAAVQVSFCAGFGPVTTVAANTSAGANQVVTPASMQGIYVGTLLTCDPGIVASREMVTVTAVTATTFTATFADAHTGPWVINCTPDEMGQAIKILVGHWYEIREPVTPQIWNKIPLSVEAILMSVWPGEYE